MPQRPTQFVARQPILTADERVFAYELLFRDSPENYFTPGTDPELASRSTIDTSILIGLNVLCDGRFAFVNCTREGLLKDYMTLLPSKRVGVEVLESVPPDELVVGACRGLKEAGYMIVLDDFCVDDPRAPLTDLADFIKIDVKQTSFEESEALIKRYGSPRCRMLAEKVETREEFLAARKVGFRYFQGYFFRRPEMMHVREIPSNRLNYLRLLQAISKPELDSNEIEDLIKGEASLCYRLLRHLQSASMGLTNEVHSVRHALVILGERAVRRWVRVVATLSAGGEKPSDLVLSALVRARFLELLAPEIKHGVSDLFLVGLLSLMDAILELPMGVVLEGISIDKETKDVLLGNPSELAPIYELMLAQEAGEWQRGTHLAARLQLPESFVAECHWGAMQWAQQVTAGA